MKTLVLSVEKKWFDMILSGEKKEEYRKIKQYWLSRLCTYEVACRNNVTSYKKITGFKEFGFVEFINGYSHNSPSFLIECKGISFGLSKPEWSYGKEESIVISLGKIIKRKNIMTRIRVRRSLKKRIIELHKEEVIKALVDRKIRREEGRFISDLSDNESCVVNILRKKIGYSAKTNDIDILQSFLRLASDELNFN